MRPFASFAGGRGLRVVVRFKHEAECIDPLHHLRRIRVRAAAVAPQSGPHVATGRPHVARQNRGADFDVRVRFGQVLHVAHQAAVRGRHDLHQPGRAMLAARLFLEARFDRNNGVNEGGRQRIFRRSDAHDVGELCGPFLRDAELLRQVGRDAAVCFVRLIVGVGERCGCDGRCRCGRFWRERRQCGRLLRRCLLRDAERKHDQPEKPSHGGVRGLGRRLVYRPIAAGGRMPARMKAACRLVSTRVGRRADRCADTHRSPDERCRAWRFGRFYRHLCVTGYVPARITCAGQPPPVQSRRSHR